MNRPAQAFPTRLATLLLAAFGCGVAEAKLMGDVTAAMEPRPGTPTATALIRDLYARYQATSTIVADGVALVSARAAGQVVETLVEEGDPVVQGQILARIDADRLRPRSFRADSRRSPAGNRYPRQPRLDDGALPARAAFARPAPDGLHIAGAIHSLIHRYAAVRAPITGIISERRIRPGQRVESGQLAFRITDTSRLVAARPLPPFESPRFARDRLTLPSVEPEVCGNAWRNK